MRSVRVSILPLLALLGMSLAPPPGARPDGDYERAAQEALTLWQEWEATQGGKGGPEKPYSPLSMEEGRALLWVPRGARKSLLKSATAKTVSRFDALFPPAEREAGAAARRTAVLFPIVGPKAYASIAGFLGEKFPRLAGWAETAPRGVGFLLEEPLVAGWLTKVPGNEVWNPENEQVNRLARLLLAERYGHLPYWLSQGLAWEIELRVCRDVYCFPFRSGFVAKKEHRTWPARLKAAMAARGERPLTVEELCRWPRNTWHEKLAVLSWGAAAMLAGPYRDELPRVLTALAAVRAAKGRKTEPDGSWRWLPDYEIPAAEQREILNRELGIDFDAELTRYARRPKGYHRPR